MRNYEFIERINVYYTVEAESEEDAWRKLDKLDTPYEKPWDSNISVDVIDCEINHIWESENA